MTKKEQKIFDIISQIPINANIKATGYSVVITETNLWINEDIALPYIKKILKLKP